MWGAGTALGELPPYFMARAARQSGETPDDEEYREFLALMEGDRPKEAVRSINQRENTTVVLVDARTRQTLDGGKGRQEHQLPHYSHLCFGAKPILRPRWYYLRPLWRALLDVLRRNSHWQSFSEDACSGMQTRVIT